MNDIKLENIKQICSKYPNIALSINDWTDMIGDRNMWGLMEIVTVKDVLMTGLYGKFLGCNCYISKVIAPGHFRISKKEKLKSPTKDLNDWSAEMSLELSADKIERYLSLPAFW
mgnify:CR=1 FL=1